MRLIYIAAGAGQMYCGACARDLALVRGLIARGHDVEIIPLYTPLKYDTDEPPNLAPVFLGGLNAWLQQHSGLFRALPKAWDRILDNPALLRLISRFALSTEASKLGAMTVSTLAGQDGLQAKEFERLLDYLKSTPAPDAIVITNSLLSGIAAGLREAFDAPILCGLQGEDNFLQALGEKHTAQAIRHVQANAAHVDLFIASSRDCARRSAVLLGLPETEIHVVRTGLILDEFAALAAQRPPAPAGGPFTVGYLSVLTPGKGLDLLVEACGALLAAGLNPRLIVAGLVLDAAYFKQVQRRVVALGLTDRFAYRGEVDREGKLALLAEAQAFCVPSRFPEARGVAIMEALAGGLPVVAPQAGAYPELLEDSEAGLLVPVGDVAAIAAALRQLVDPVEAHRRGQLGAALIAGRHHADLAAEEMLQALETATQRRSPRAETSGYRPLSP